MEVPILISHLNDFIFCPASIYFHQLYGSTDTMLFQCSDQINGTHAHKTIDTGKYSSKRNILQGINVYCEEYNIIGKIDIYDIDTGVLTERKKKIKVVYDGYIYQLYAQYFALSEMGYSIKKIRLHSLDDNKIYGVALPEDDEKMFYKFVRLLKQINEFNISAYKQCNVEKCKKCIYEPACDRSLL